MLYGDNVIPEYILPDELKQETYELRPHVAEFDRLDLVVTMKPGKDGKGAIVESFIEAISNHDAVAKLIEEKMSELDELKKIFKKKHRIFRNWDSAHNIMNVFPDDMAEYKALLPKMANYEERIEEIKDPKILAQAVAERERFLELEVKCSQLQAVQKALFIAKQLKEASLANMQRAQKELIVLQDEEKRLSYRITDDHVVADEMGIYIGDFFANVHPGYLLNTFNGRHVADAAFETIMKMILTSKAGQKCEFLRYDYRFDRVLGQWLSLEQLRELNIFLNDPRLDRLEYVKSAARGSLDDVKKEINKGQVVDAYDHARTSAFHVAAVNGHNEIVDYLISEGAKVDHRDKNLMTPLLSCIFRGRVDMVRKLCKNGASKEITDRKHRGVMYYAAYSGEIVLAKMFMNQHNINKNDQEWGWTPLHVAASTGNMEMVELLLDNKASIYRLSFQEKTPEDVAKDCRHTKVYEHLKEVRLTAPGQVVYTHEATLASIWIGEFSALNAEWITELGATDIICLVKDEDFEDPNGGRGVRGTRIKNAEREAEKAKRMGGGLNGQALNSLNNNNKTMKGNNKNLMTIKKDKHNKVKSGILQERKIDESKQQQVSNINHSSDEPEDESNLYYAYEIPGAYWLQQDENIQSTAIHIEADDEDRGHDSWKNMLPLLQTINACIQHFLKKKRGRLLICDSSGCSTCVAAYCAFQLLVYQHRVEESIAECTVARPAVSMSMSLRRGLEIMQRTLDEKRLKRLRDKVRTAQVLSNAF